MIELIWNEGLQLLAACTVAVLGVLLVRTPLRRWLGAEMAYLAWAAVPLALLAVLLPGLPAAPLPAAGQAAWTSQAAVVLGAALPRPQPGAHALLLATWGLGALSAALVLARTQWRFARRVRRCPGEAFDRSDEASPAVFGLWRPRIVLPGDFHQRYDAREQALLLAHEHEHVRRLDIPAQALASALRCLFWFNPLVHLAARRFRLDQELACDAAVLRGHPGERRRYGEAMLKTQLAALSLPLGCHWPSCHPLKERITMLKQPTPGPARRRVGSALLAGGLAAFALGSWAAQPVASAPRPLQVVTADDYLGPPKYPRAAAEQGLSGLVVLDVLVGADGVPSDVRVHRASPEGVFEKLAVAAARDWRFNAGREGRRGDKVEGWIRVPVKFTAPDPSAPQATPETTEADA